MSGTSTWKLYPEKQDIATQLAQHLDIRPVTAQILLNRNIRSLEEAQQFITPPSIDHLAYFLEDKMKAAAELLWKSIQSKKIVGLYGDYDVDGMTSTSMMVHVLRALDAPYYYYVPHRVSEGYGLNKKALAQFIERDCGIVMTLDCGISSYDEITYLKEKLSCDVVIMDHHTIPEKVPPADVILNPIELDADHPSHKLCTAGLVYLFLSYFIKHLKLDIDPTHFLDLAALGTVADVVPLRGSNRQLTQHGLKKMSHSPGIGVKSLLSSSNFKKARVTARDIGFVLAPRLNAAGRLTHAKEGISLLTSTTHQDALKVATRLEALNLQRRQIGEMILKQAKAMLSTKEGPFQVIVLSSSEWHAGVIGITASQLVSQFQCPAILIAEDDHIGRGSARSVPGVNVYELLKSCDSFFESFGGHHQAAGFSILPKNIPAFQEALQAKGVTMIQGEDLNRVLDVDAKITPTELSLELARELQKLAPFGEGNPEPILYCNHMVPVDFKTVGNGSHLKVTFKHPETDRIFEAIGFGLADKIDRLYQPHVELIFHLGINEWSGIELPQLELLDIK